jgi:hypothetical protein
MTGRLGNQMFQIANVYAQSIRHNRQLILPKHDTSVSDYYSTVFRKLEFTIDRSPENDDSYHYIQSPHHYTLLTPHDTKPTVFRGYFESEKFFKEYANEIKSLYGPTEEFLTKVYQEYPQLKQGITSAIVVRRGDFLTFPNRHPVVSKDYLYMVKEMLPQSDFIFIVSDDVEWCKQNLHFSNVVYVDYIRHEALWLLSLCHHFAISNSTFTWWGAWLSDNPNKVVIAPEVWFGPELLVHADPKDVYCEKWIKAPCKYDPSGFIIP